jgi:hypothetical protein
MQNLDKVLVEMVLSNSINGSPVMLEQEVVVLMVQVVKIQVELGRFRRWWRWRSWRRW